MTVHAFKARYVFPVSSEPIDDGMVCIQDEHIVSVGELASADTVTDLGNSAILPGFVNTHTHLELSNIAKPLGSPGMGFADWIRKIIDYRRSSDNSNSNAVENGLRECVRCGVTTVGDITQNDCSIPVLKSPFIDGAAFYELIAPTADRFESVFNLARNHLFSKCTKGADDSSPYWQLGLSPHASYSVHLEFLEKITELSAQHHIPLAMHLAESREEIQWLADGTGPLKQLLLDLGASQPNTTSTNSRALDFLRKLSVAHRVLVIHGNYLDDEEIAFLADRADTMAVVYCPRTHHFFGHDRYPLEKILSAGVLLCIGTDSRASSPDLDMLAELRHIARYYPEIAPAEILKFGTLNGAKALGRDGEIGSIEAGKYANLAIVHLPENSADDPHELLLESDMPVAGTWFRGKQIYQ